MEGTLAEVNGRCRLLLTFALPDRCLDFLLDASQGEGCWGACIGELEHYV
jgi:hypothetical protein